jgi:hypothetical protein
VSARRRRNPKADTLRQLRAAALRKWRSGYNTPGQIAAALDVPEWWIHEAIKRDRADVFAAWEALGRLAIADDIAAATELPRGFVVYLMRLIHGTKNERRSRGSRSMAAGAGGKPPSSSARTTSAGPREQRRAGRRGATESVTSSPSS